MSGRTVELCMGAYWSVGPVIKIEVMIQYASTETLSSYIIQGTYTSVHKIKLYYYYSVTNLNIYFHMEAASAVLVQYEVGQGLDDQ